MKISQRQLNRLSALSIAMLSVACGDAQTARELGSRLGEQWNPQNAPINMGPDYVTNFDSLPLSAALPRSPWSDYYWPSVEGGISNRWLGGGPVFRPRFFALKRMPLDRIARMSPAEKYDAFVGNYNYEIKSQERARTRFANQSWEGICHGWAPASMIFHEPRPVTLVGANGIEIPFGSSDIKALLSFYVGQVAESPTKFLGERCNYDLNATPGASGIPACRDTNAGAFHIVLTNYLGLKHKGFVIDRDRSIQVWNQPVWRYQSIIEGTSLPSPGAAPGTVREIIVRSDVTYVVEVYPQWDALDDESPSFTASYRYRLELDQTGSIIGGEWLSNDRPDFMWTQEPPQFTGYFEALGNIYRASTGQQ